MTWKPKLVPGFVDSLERMSRDDPAAFGRVPFPSQSKKAQKFRQDRFEDAVCRALELAGLHTQSLGHTAAGRDEPDGVSVFYGAKSFALIVDAKVAAHGYRLPVKDRRALESYVRKWDLRLDGSQGGYQEIHVAIVSSGFPADLTARITQMRNGCKGTRFGRVLLVPTSGLKALVEARLGDARLGVTFYQEILQSGETEITPEVVSRARRQVLRLAEHT